MRRLLIRPGGIGDFLLSLPALECLKEHFTEVWTTPRNVPLARFADRARAIPSTGLDLLGVTDPPPELVDSLRGFDSIVSWYGANRPEFRDPVSALGLPFTFFPALPTENPGMHAADFYLSQARTLTSKPSDGIPRLACAPAPHPYEPYAVIHPFSGSPRKNWPIERFRALARELERSMRVRWCAGPDDPPLADAVHIDDLYQLACWLAGASFYMGNDSGITHLAAAAGTPVLAFFGPTDPAVWAPRGPNVKVERWPE